MARDLDHVLKAAVRLLSRWDQWPPQSVHVCISMVEEMGAEMQLSGHEYRAMKCIFLFVAALDSSPGWPEGGPKVFRDEALLTPAGLQIFRMSAEVISTLESETMQ